MNINPIKKFHHTTCPTVGEASKRRQVNRRCVATVGAPLLATAVLFSATSGAIVDGAVAVADPASIDLAAPPGPTWVPSAPPITTATADGWTLTMSANSERQDQVPPLLPDAKPPRDYIVGGLFNATLRGPDGTTAPTPTGSIEAGYQVHCVGGAMMTAMMMMGATKPAEVTIKVLEQDFTGADASVAITDFRVQVDCPSPATIRSYAILRRNTATTHSVVAYYGTPIPA